jgi:hypothetical protein
MIRGGVFLAAVLGMTVVLSARGATPGRTIAEGSDADLSRQSRDRTSSE